MQGFAQTPLPSPLVRAFALLLPFLEAVLGLRFNALALDGGWNVRKR